MAATAPIESASFVRLIARADGDALAASGLLTRALADRGTPFQLTVARTVGERTDRARAADADRNGDCTLVVGAVDAELPQLGATDRPATLEVCDVLRELGETPDPVLALAGVATTGTDPGAGESEWLLEAARDRELVDRCPGLVVPTADPIDGIAHSTRLRAPWSGDREAAREALAPVLSAESNTDDDSETKTSDLDDDHRAIGSAVALDAVGADEATPVAATTIQSVLAPYATPAGPFATIGGYADVLEASARSEPGTGGALAMGHDASEPALAAWRAYGQRTHEALATASTSRYDGLFVVECDGPVEAIARIVVGYRSPEPVVLVVGDGEAGLASRETALGSTVEGVARELTSETDRSVEYDVVRRRGYLQYDRAVDESTIITTVREFQ